MSDRLCNIPPIRATQRWYQQPALDYWCEQEERGRAVEVWARRTGKDLTYMNVALWKSYQRRGMYLHMLPEFAHARRTLWEGFTNDGERMIDAAFPPEVRHSINDHEMRIVLRDQQDPSRPGSVWQLGGSDQYDRWVGGNPIFITYSEFALAHPRGWDLMRPILRNNRGHAAFISTPRGYNHFHEMLLMARREGWRNSVITAIEAGIMTHADIEQEIREGMPEELARQEYLCDFSAANVGAILGKYIEAADKQGRIVRDLHDQTGERIDLSADIGFRDTAAFWFWQPWFDGFGLVDYDEDNGLDASQWIERLAAKRWRYGTIYLPHDARAKTFSTRHSVIEQFLAAKRDKVLDCEAIEIVPQVHTQDRINAARTVLPRCRFDAVNTAAGLMTLREWSFKYDEERKTYSKEPDHNWASHGADAFTYGAMKMRERTRPAAPPPKQPARSYAQQTLDDLWAEREHDKYERERMP